MRLYESVYLSVYNSIFHPIGDIIHGAVIAYFSDDEWDLLETSIYDPVYLPRSNFVHSHVKTLLESYDT